MGPRAPPSGGDPFSSGGDAAVDAWLPGWAAPLVCACTGVGCGAAGAAARGGCGALDGCARGDLSDENGGWCARPPENSTVSALSELDVEKERSAGDA